MSIQGGYMRLYRHVHTKQDHCHSTIWRGIAGAREDVRRVDGGKELLGAQGLEWSRQSIIFGNAHGASWGPWTNERVKRGFRWIFGIAHRP